MTVSDIFAQMSLGAAPESAAVANQWLDAHQRRFGLYIGGSWQLPSADAVAAARKEFQATVERAKEQLDMVEALTAVPGMRAGVEAVLLRGTGGNNLFNQRLKELKAIDLGRDAMVDIHRVSDQLGTEVAAVVERIRAETSAVITRSDSTIETGVIIVLAIAAASLIVSATSLL